MNDFTIFTILFKFGKTQTILNYLTLLPEFMIFGNKINCCSASSFDVISWNWIVWFLNFCGKFLLESLLIAFEEENSELDYLYSANHTEHNDDFVAVDVDCITNGYVVLYLTLVFGNFLGNLFGF